MSSRKRSRHCVDDADLGVIKLSPGANRTADFTLLRACSSCARGLPAAAQEWDLSGLQINGQAVEQQTVEAWLWCVETAIHGPAADDASHAVDDVLTKAAGLYKLLSFADAVGSSGGVLSACLGQLHALQVAVTVGEHSRVIMINKGGYTCADRRLCPIRGPSLGPAFESLQQQNEFAAKVARQVEGLLFMAHKLQLQQLLETVHMFVFECHVPDCGLFEGRLHLVFSERVMAAAVGSNSSIASQRAYFTSVLARPCGMHGTVGLQPLMELVGSASFDKPTQQLRFKAKMQKDILGCSKGEQVDVVLSLFPSDEFVVPTLRIGATDVPAQLLLGFGVWDDFDYKQLIAPETDNETE